MYNIYSKNRNNFFKKKKGIFLKKKGNFEEEIYLYFVLKILYLLVLNNN